MLAVNEINDEINATPALSNGQVYVRAHARRGVLLQHFAVAQLHAIIMKFALKPILIGTGAGLVLCLALLCLVASNAFGTYETASVARVLFPFALAVDANDSTWVSLSFFFLQYPLYGAMLGNVWNWERRRILILAAVLALIVGGHLAAVRSAERAYVIRVDSQVWE